MREDLIPHSWQKNRERICSVLLRPAGAAPSATAAITTCGLVAQRRVTVGRGEALNSFRILSFKSHKQCRSGAGIQRGGRRQSLVTWFQHVTSAAALVWGNTPLCTASIEMLCVYRETVFILSTLHETKVCTRYARTVSSGMASPVLPRYLGRESKEPLFPNYFWVVARMRG